MRSHAAAAASAGCHPVRVCHRAAASAAAPRVVAAAAAPRGTHDFIGPPAALRRAVAAAAVATAEAYRFVEAVTPMFEFTHVFERSLGAGSDVVQKEMYTFKDKSDQSVTLRPEGTAGVEMLGESTASADVEIMECGARALAAMCAVLRLDSSLFELHVNTLGGRESQAAYRTVLEEYLRGSEGKLSNDSKERLRRGAVLRVLDSKDAVDAGVIEGAPHLAQSLTPGDRERFEAVLEGAAAVGLPIVRNSRLVRGLDYYSHTAFEFVARGASGGQLGTVLAGGRYDGLVAAMGGTDLAGVGWATGVDRLVALAAAAAGGAAQPAAEAPFVVVVPVATDAAAGTRVDVACLRAAKALRDGGVRVHSAFGARSLRKQMQAANSHGASAVVLIGPDDVARGVAQVKDMATGAQVTVPLDDAAALAAACRRV